MKNEIIPVAVVSCCGENRGSLRRLKVLLSLLYCLSVTCLALSGCSISPPVTYYALTATAPLAAAPLSKSLPSLAITSISLPELIDRPHLVIAGEGNQVAILELHRWGENLKNAIPRVVADNLSRQLGSENVSFYPQAMALGADYTVTIDFQHFDAHGDTVSVDALWTIKRAGQQLTRGRTRVEEKGNGGLSSLVDAYSRALATVSAEIAQGVTAKK